MSHVDHENSWIQKSSSPRSRRSNTIIAADRPCTNCFNLAHEPVSSWRSIDPLTVELLMQCELIGSPRLSYASISIVRGLLGLIQLDTDAPLSLQRLLVCGGRQTELGQNAFYFSLRPGSILRIVSILLAVPVSTSQSWMPRERPSHGAIDGDRPSRSS